MLQFVLPLKLPSTLPLPPVGTACFFLESSKQTLQELPPFLSGSHGSTPDSYVVIRLSPQHGRSPLPIKALPSKRITFVGLSAWTDFPHLIPFREIKWIFFFLRGPQKLSEFPLPRSTPPSFSSSKRRLPREFFLLSRVGLLFPPFSLRSKECLFTRGITGAKPSSHLLRSPSSPSPD